jgi:hypothetical protein
MITIATTEKRRNTEKVAGVLLAAMGMSIDSSIGM